MKHQQHVDYQMLPYPRMRRLEAIAYRSVLHKPMMHGLIDVDVTRARTRLKEYKMLTGESLSFTAFLIGCLAKAVDEHKAVQAYRKGGRHLIVKELIESGSGLFDPLVEPEQTDTTLTEVNNVSPSEESKRS